MDFACLSTGCLADIFGGLDYDKPILQVLGTKHISSGDGDGDRDGRYRLLVSDGKYSISHAVLATQLNSVAIENKLTDNTIIRVEKYIISTVSQDRKVIIILDLTVLDAGAAVKGKIGEPTLLNDANIQNKSTASIQTFSTNQLTNSNFTPAPTASIQPISPNQPINSNAIRTIASNAPSPSSVTNSSRVTTSSSDEITLISSLSPFTSKWVIRARVTAKSNIRKWSNQRGEGRLFTIDLQDESGEIRATCFNEQALQYFDFIQPDKVYDISKCRLKSANKQYSSIDNDYEMSFIYHTTVKEYDGADFTIPKVTYNVVALSDIEKMDVNSIVDVAGICQHVGDIVAITAKTTGREFKKREVTLADNSLVSVNVTLWEQDAEKFDGSTDQVIFIKGGKIHEFAGGRTITLTGSSSMRINPDITEAHRLRGWYDNEGHTKIYSCISTTRTIAADSTAEFLSFYEATERALGSSEKNDYFQCIATVHYIKTKSCTYKSCPKPNCNKKVVDQDNGLYRCDVCQLEKPDFQYKILLNTSLADWTNHRWATIFNDQAEKLLETSSTDVGHAADKNDDELNKIVSKALFKTFNFRLRTKMEKYGDAERNKIQVMNISPINYKDYNQYLIKNIETLTGIGKYENPHPQ